MCRKSTSSYLVCCPTSLLFHIKFYIKTNYWQIVCSFYGSLIAFIWSGHQERSSTQRQKIVTEKSCNYIWTWHIYSAYRVTFVYILFAKWIFLSPNLTKFPVLSKCKQWTKINFLNLLVMIMWFFSSQALCNKVT